MASSNMVARSHSALALYTEVCRPVCTQLGLGQTAFDILLLLGTHPELRTARDVVQTGGIKKNLVSMNVEKLAEQGYLERKPIPGDRRQVRLVLTAKAAPVVDMGLRVQEYYYNALIQGLTEEELAVYRRCSDAIARNMDRLARLLQQDQNSTPY